MEPTGLIIATLVVGLLVLAMSIDQLTADALESPDKTDPVDGKEQQAPVDDR